tara:strand:- start:411 stop:794 length:384 start_codon:yes stop_codon:yes gene_type:complete
MNKRTGSAVPSDEYNAMKIALEKQAQVGTGMSLEATRNSKYGNVNYPGLTQGLVQGTESMSEVSSNANAPLSKPTAQTAQLGFFSATQNPQQQPEMMGREAEEGIKQRILGEPGGLNNRQELYRRGN